MHRADRGAELNARQPLHRIAAGTAAIALSAVWLGPSAAAAQPVPTTASGQADTTTETVLTGSPALTLAEQEALLTAYERVDRANREVYVHLASSQRDTATAPAPPAPTPTKTSSSASSSSSSSSSKKTSSNTTKKQQTTTTTVKPPSGAAGTVVSFAMAQVGKPYVYAASGPNAYDCSGLVAAAYAKVGIKLPHQSEQIAARGRQVPAGQWMPGDVIHTSGHVAIYIGGGKMVEAANPSAGIRVAPVRGGTAYRFL
ncbi:C40 family peptidase [Dactylosporangium sp. NPDC051541]|uniref:C40 family peptidase n=1 Tax=Dactylosporangium sp. NPDC051541 TaxID=3363977 RepID=UPI0037AD1E1B